MSNKTNIEEDIKRYEELKRSRTIVASIEPDFFFDFVDNILADRERLEKENKNLKMILETGLNKDKQYCFNEDGNTGKCLGYGDDEPCEYCKTCERLSIKETD